MANRLSQQVVEVLYSTSGAKARASQEAVEVLFEPASSNARVSQEALELLFVSAPSVAIRTSQVAVEALTDSPREPLPFIDSTTIVYPPTLLETFASTRVSQVSLEAIASDTTGEGLVSQITLEVLMPRPTGMHVWFTT